MQKYPIDDKAPTYINKRIARGIFSLLEQQVEGIAVELEKKTLGCDSDNESDLISITSAESDTSDSSVHNVTTSSTSYMHQHFPALHVKVFTNGSQIHLRKILAKLWK